MRWQLAGVVVLAMASCKPHGVEIAKTIEAFRGFVTQMCACTDKACADKVQDAMTAWSKEMAQTSTSANDRVDEATLKVMTELGEKYATCMTKALEPPVPAPPPERAPVTLSSPRARPSIATLIEQAKAYTHATEEQLAIHELTARYVGLDGALDPRYGELTIGFGNPQAASTEPAPDDPDRPTGAPIPDPPEPAEAPTRSDMDLCPKALWTMKAGWSWDKRLCLGSADLVPRCSMAEVWKRARAKGAPAKALAIIELGMRDDGAQQWSFSIHDPLRKVDIDLRVPDTCTAMVEKP